MSTSTLRVVERDTVDRSKALDAALTQIERAFGKGSIMRFMGLEFKDSSPFIDESKF